MRKILRIAVLSSVLVAPPVVTSGAAADAPTLAAHFASVSGAADAPMSAVGVLMIDVTGDGEDEVFLASAAATGNDGNVPWHVYTPIAGGALRYLGVLYLQDGGFYWDAEARRLISVVYLRAGEELQIVTESCSFAPTGFDCEELPASRDAAVDLKTARAWETAVGGRYIQTNLRAIERAAGGETPSKGWSKAVGGGTVSLPAGFFSRRVVEESRP